MDITSGGSLENVSFNWETKTNIFGTKTSLNIKPSENDPPIKLIVKKSLSHLDKALASLSNDKWMSLQTDKGTVYVKRSNLEENYIDIQTLQDIVQPKVTKDLVKSKPTSQWVSAVAKKKFDSGPVPLNEEAEKIRTYCKKKIPKLDHLTHASFKSKRKNQKYTLFGRGQVYIHGPKLGKGSYKTAVTARDVIQNETIALLKSKITSPIKRHVAKKEERNLEKFIGSEHVVQLKNVSWFQDGKKSEQVMITELCNGGELESWIPGVEKKQIYNLTVPQKLKIALDSILGIDEMHKKNYIHSDLKPANLFIKFDPLQPKQISAKIGDLGLAYHLVELGTHRGLERGTHGNVQYMAPRRFEQRMKSKIDDLKVYKTSFMKPKAIEEQFADEKFELGLILFQLFYPDEFNEIPWEKCLIEAISDYEELIQLHNDFKEGIINKSRFEKEFKKTTNRILTSIEETKNIVSTFVAKEISQLNDNYPPGGERELRKTILHMLEHANLQATKDSLEEEKKVFTRFVEQNPIS